MFICNSSLRKFLWYILQSEQYGLLESVAHGACNTFITQYIKAMTYVFY